MNKEDVKKAIELAKAYNLQIEAGHKDSEEFDMFWEFIEKRTDNVYARSLAISIFYDGYEIGLSEKEITLMLTIAGLYKETENV